MMDALVYSSKLSSLVLISLGILLTYQFTKVVYRLFFHPLHRFPGPKLAAATWWYEIYFDVFVPPQGQFIYQLDRLHEQYGPIIRCSPEEIHVKDSQFFDTLYVGPGRGKRDRWERSIRVNSAPGATASTLGHDMHRMRRSTVNPFFSKRAIDELEVGTRDRVDLLCNRIREFARAGKEINMGAAFTALTLDVITAYCFDECYNCIEEPDFDPRWHGLLNGLFEGIPVFKHFFLLFQISQSLPQWLSLALNPDLKPVFLAKAEIARQAKQSWAEEMHEAGSKGGASEERAKTIFRGIMRANAPPEEKTVERLSNEALVLIVAGAETTAKVLTLIMCYLVRDRELFDRVRAEVDKIYVGPEIPASKVIEANPLLRGVVQEGLRMASPVTNRQVLIAPDEDLRYDKWVIPRGTPTSMTYDNVLKDPKIYPEPYKFIPDRWIDNKQLDRFQVTFAKGNRSCLGINLASSELYLGMVALMRHFDIEFTEDFVKERDLDTVRDAFVGLPSKESRGIRVRVQERKDRS